MRSREQAAIALYGGTFDPVHRGHIDSAVAVAKRLGVRDFRMLPAGQPPHRPAPGASPRQRLDMLRLAIAGIDILSVDETEIHRAGPSYMVTTLGDLRRDHAEAPLLLVIGQDAANSLDQWHQWRRLFDLAHIVIMSRPGQPQGYSGLLAEAISQRLVVAAEELVGAHAGKVLPLKLESPDISSTEVRRMIRQGTVPECWVPAAVMAYIRTHGLYQATPAG